MNKFFCSLQRKVLVTANLMPCKSKKIAVLNAWPNDAESEIAQRFVISAKRLGHYAEAVSNAYEIERLHPDFVITLTRLTPKTTEYPTYHVANLPITHYWEFASNFDKDCWKSQRNIDILMTYDACLTNSKSLQDKLDPLFIQRGKAMEWFLDYYSTLPKSEFFENKVESPKLAYFGINWDKDRFKDLFENLIKTTDFLRLYGRPTGWSDICQSAYQGMIPFDGKSVIDEYQKCGVGLCLHRDDFIKENMPTNRIFEIAASGVPIIASRMPFIEDNFSNNVLYVDQSESPKNLAGQIACHMDWITNNPDEASRKAKSCHKIFLERFSQEDVLTKLCSFHDKTLIKRGYKRGKAKRSSQVNRPKFKVVIERAQFTKAGLKSLKEQIKEQTYEEVDIVDISLAQNRWPIFRTIKELVHRPLAKFSVINSSESLIEENMNLYFIRALNGSVFHANHFALLAEYIERNGDVQVLATNCVERYEGTTFFENDKSERTDADSRRDLVFFRTEDNTRLFSVTQFTKTDLKAAFQSSPHAFAFKTLTIDDKTLPLSAQVYDDMERQIAEAKVETLAEVTTSSLILNVPT